MPIIKSAKKRVKVAAKANTRNNRTRRTLREALKSYSAALLSGKPAEISKAQAAAVSALDMAAKKNVIHKNKAARKKSLLSAQAKAAGVKPAKSAAKPANKPAAKKAQPTKPSAKVQAGKAKNPAAKKPVAKKTAKTKK